MSSSTKVVQYSDVSGPVAGQDFAGVKGVARYAAATTVQSAAVPYGWKGCFVDIAPSGSAVDYAYATGSLPAAITYGALAPIGTGSFVAGWNVPNGMIDSRKCPSNATFISFVSEAAVGRVAFMVSEGVVQSPPRQSGSFGPQQ